MMKWIKRMFGFGGRSSPPPSGPSTPPTTLRNKPGGQALVKVPDRYGLQELNGCIVTTVHVTRSPLWKIEPVLAFTPTDFLTDSNGKTAVPGIRKEILAMGDQYLIPLKNPGESERDETLDWLPVPATPLVKETIKEN